MNNHKTSCTDLVNQCFAWKLPQEIRTWVKQMCDTGTYQWQDIAVAVTRLFKGDEALIAEMDTASDLQVRLVKRRLQADQTLIAAWPEFLKRLLKICPDADAALVSHVFAAFLSGFVTDEETLKKSISRHRTPSAP